MKFLLFLDVVHWLFGILATSREESFSFADSTFHISSRAVWFVSRRPRSPTVVAGLPLASILICAVTASSSSTTSLERSASSVFDSERRLGFYCGMARVK